VRPIAKRFASRRSSGNAPRGGWLAGVGEEGRTPPTGTPAHPGSPRQALEDLADRVRQRTSNFLNRHQFALGTGLRNALLMGVLGGVFLYGCLELYRFLTP
jgi:hypothetical protein